MRSLHSLNIILLYSAYFYNIKALKICDIFTAVIDLWVTCMVGDSLSPAAITRDLETRFVGQRVIYYPSLTSTNEVAKQEAQRGAAEGTVVIADEQTVGRETQHLFTYERRGGGRPSPPPPRRGHGGGGDG